MSVVNPRNEKILLERIGSDSFWVMMRKHFLQNNRLSKTVLRRRWKYLAMLALRENAGWPLDVIGEVFGHPKGHVTRCLGRIKDEIRETFDLNPEYLVNPDDLVLDESLQEGSPLQPLPSSPTGSTSAQPPPRGATAGD